MTEKESGVERVAGSLVAQGAAAALAAYAGTMSAALLPVLASSLADGRHKARMEKQLRQITEELERVSEKVKNISDEGYKLINEMILTVLQTTDEKKLEYLRNAIVNGVSLEQMEHVDSYQLSRTIRDISAEELAFIIEYSGYDEIMMGTIVGAVQVKGRVFQLKEGSPLLKLFTGLISLGVIVPKGSSADDLGRYVFSPLASTLANLVSRAD